MSEKEDHGLSVGTGGSVALTTLQLGVNHPYSAGCGRTYVVQKHATFVRIATRSRWSRVIADAECDYPADRVHRRCGVLRARVAGDEHV